MSVHKSGTKAYYIKYKNKTYRGFKTKSDALEYESKLKLLNDASSPLLLNINTIAREYLKYSYDNLQYGTYQKSKHIIEDIILPNIPNKIIIDFKERDCLKFRSYVNSLNYSTTYKNDILIRFKSIFKYACKFCELDKDPTRCIDRYKKTYEEKKEDYNKQFNVWSYEEFNRFISKVKQYRYKVFYTCLYLTGMRLGECLALTWNDINENKISIIKNLTRKTETGHYEIKETKTKNSMRTITINKSLEELLKEYKASEMSVPGFNEEWFVFGRIKPLSNTSIDRIKERAIRESGIKRIRIHDFRHSFATNMINDGVNIVAVSKALGHSSITQTLDTYTHLLQKTDDEMIEKLEVSSQNLLKNLLNADLNK